MLERFSSFNFSQIPAEALSTVQILNTMNLGFNLSDNHVPPTMYQYLLPTFFAFFTGPIVANVVYPYFKFTNRVLISYLLGFSLFFTMKRFRHARAVCSAAPLIGKILIGADMKNSTEPVHALLFWVLICTFVNILVYKILINEKSYEISECEFRDVVCTTLCIAAARMLNLSDASTAILVATLYLVLCRSGTSCVSVMMKRAKNLADTPNEAEDGIEGDTTVDGENTADDDTMTPKRRGRPRKNGSKTTTPKRKAARKLNFEEE